MSTKKSKRITIFILAVVMLFVVALTGCVDRSEDEIEYTPEETTQSPERVTQPHDRVRVDPNAPLPPLPPRNPDGTLG